MENIESKNTVESNNQVKKHVFFEGTDGGSPRVMFLGNSITRHGPKADIGWSGDWGMAASSKDKDYVHICIKYIVEKYPNAFFCIVQGSEWERNYKNFNFKSLFSAASEFKPDILICCISANIPMVIFEHSAFIENIGKFHKYLTNGKPDTKIIITSSWFNNKEKSAAIKEYAANTHAEYVDISDIFQDKNNLPTDFWHEGVSVHPGDNGMKIIAERIIRKLNGIIG